jgi:hypothetical protein
MMLPLSARSQQPCCLPCRGAARGHRSVHQLTSSLTTGNYVNCQALSATGVAGAESTGRGCAGDTASPARTAGRSADAARQCQVLAAYHIAGAPTTTRFVACVDRASRSYCTCCLMTDAGTYASISCAGQFRFSCRLHCHKGAGACT